MENMIITQDRSTAVNLSNVFYLEVISARTMPGNYELVACGQMPEHAVSLGTFTKKTMAEDVRDDIIRWNTINTMVRTEYKIPEDKPDWMSTSDAITLYGSRMLVEKPWEEKDEQK